MEVQTDKLVMGRSTEKGCEWSSDGEAAYYDIFELVKEYVEDQ